MRTESSRYFGSSDYEEEISDTDDDALWLLNCEDYNTRSNTFRTKPKRRNLNVEINASRNEADFYSSSPLQRIIVHLDVDCFYCQCEEVADSSGRLSTTPFAIGQKHIIVTCNYVARKLGVKKLMSKRNALKICPTLKIIDGSDISRYRTQSRNIYITFRNAVKALGGGNCNHVCKGSMDEMFADITASVDLMQDERRRKSENKNLVLNNTFIYGNQSSTISISEDQSGANATISLSNGARHEVDDIKVSSRMSFYTQDLWGSKNDRLRCIERFKLSSDLAHIVKQKVLKETKFTTCLGISVSPMLAKIASDLKKPNSLNMLYPWRSMNIFESMPLRRIPQLGSRTLKILNECLTEEFPCRIKTENHWWTCRDLLQVPKHKVMNCLKQSKQFRMNCEYHATFLIQRCQGIDLSDIVDDGGRVAKTVSVEDSFRNGSITSQSQIFEAIEPILGRLPILLEERRWNSTMPSLAFPNTIRVCMRNLITNDESLENSARRRVSTSRQQKVDGQVIMSKLNENEQIDILRAAIIPLVKGILDEGNNINNDIRKNITRINIAVTNFADIKEEGSKRAAGKDMASITSHFSRMKRKVPSKEVEHKLHSCAKTEPSPVPLENQKKRSHHQYSEESIPDWIDPDVLSELPADIVNDILNQNSDSLKKPESRQSTKKKRGIEAFFTVKSKKY